MFSFFNKNKRLLKQAEKGNTRAVLRLLNRGADVNSTDEDGFSPLIEALRWQHQDTAEALISAGADVNHHDTLHGETPLTIAGWNGLTKATKLLLAAGAEVNATNKYGTTALISAARCGHTEVVRLLLAAGADIHARCQDGNALSVALSLYHQETAEVLKAAGATLNLMEAAYCGQSDLVRRHLAEGADPDEGAAIVRAAFGGHTEIVRLLVEAGADIDAQDTLEQMTALHHAARWGHTEMAEMLLKAGARADIRDKDRFNALDIAVWSGRAEVVRLLLAHRQPDVNVRVGGFCLLHWAASSGDTEIVRMLLQAGADVHARTLIFHETALKLALKGHHSETAELLRSAGASE